MWAALRTGLADYVGKNGFPGVILGLSGGIDSALTAAIAADALGAERVTGVALPSVHSSSESMEGAQQLAESLGIRFVVVPIAGIVEGFDDALAELFAGLDPDITEENIQARARGTVLMALSNKLGALVLATGNKSEISVGYSTLYGDMVGGFAPLRDLSKTWVYRLARWRNASEGREVIPERTIVRPPTAELRPGQLDQDSLPPYDQLDAILEGYVEHRPRARRAGGGRIRRGRGRRRRAEGRPRRVQAPAGAGRDQDHPAGLRPRPPDADHHQTCVGHRSAAAGRSPPWPPPPSSPPPPRPRRPPVPPSRPTRPPGPGRRRSAARRPATRRCW